METYNHIPKLEKSVVSIGSFDGVHSGHRKVLQKLKALAKVYDCPATIITFDPHPREILFPNDDSLKILNSKAEKAYILEQIGIDILVFAPFTLSFSKITAMEYLENFLVKNFHPRALVFGYDHHFGKDREGNVAFLNRYKEKFRYDVQTLDLESSGGNKISSSLIRRLIKEGQLAKANQLLDHPYMLSGKVYRGLNLGSKIGFPTANIAIDHPHKLIPPTGVYAARAILGQQKYDGMLYIGHRPVLKDNRLSVEIHIFDFDQQIYDQFIYLELYKYLRSDMHFPTLEKLAAQLEKDQDKVKAYFKYQNSLSKSKV